MSYGRALQRNPLTCTARSDTAVNAQSVGRIHKPQIKTIDGVLYCNDGDWVESLSALVETFEGELKIVEWQRRLLPAESAPFIEHEEEAHA